MPAYRDIHPAKEPTALPETTQTELMSAVENAELIVMPTDTVYGIGANPFSVDAVRRLLGSKGRDESMPPPVLAAFTEDLLPMVSFDSVRQRDAFRALAANFWPGPLTIIATAAVPLGWDTSSVGDTVAVRVPSEETTLAALRITGPLAVTSANRTGMPPAQSVEAAREYFGDEVAVYLEGDEAGSGRPSTIVDCTVWPVRAIREGAISQAQISELLKSL